MTNQTEVISVLDISTDVARVTSKVNSFITAGNLQGFTNFQIERVVVTPETNASGVATGKNWYTVQINYYDPAVYG